MPGEIFDSTSGPYASPWVAFCRCAAVMSAAGLECAMSFWRLPSSPVRSFAALSRALDGYMRTAGFLRLMQISLKLTTQPSSWMDIATSSRRSP